MIKTLALPALSSFLLAAHFSRIQNDWLALLALLFPLLLFIKREWIIRIYQIYLVCGGLIWIERLIYLRSIRISEQRPWIRLVIILGIVALLTFLSAVLLQRKKLRRIYEYKIEKQAVPYVPSLIAFSITASLLTFVHFQVDPPILLIERFLPGSFGIEIFALSLYAAFITELMIDPTNFSKIRGRIWTFFSVVFFTQFFLGISGFEKFLMTGRLHLPIPAMIIAGPLFRGHGFFMLILFTATVILAGSAWCSHLCYVGSWDNLASRSLKKPKSLPEWWKSVRYSILIMIILLSLLFRFLGMSAGIATGTAILFGIVGAAIMVFISRKIGMMTHCLLYCPIGLIADILGKLSPFRIRFKSTCDDCGACRYSCRYQALESENIQRKKPGFSCTLCGDCLAACPKDALQYKFIRLPGHAARKVFIVLIVALHAVFLGVARL